ncbi:MAG: penicillin-binding protein 1B [Gammaproteobacteria bacterium]|nr:penicillin-binding protein 1B [Gammaproteobacteria bacterium]
MARPSSSVRRPFWAALVLALAAGLVAASVYLIHLDAEVQRLYANVRWVLPAQVYAAPMEIYPGASLSLDDFHAQLQRLGYRQQPQLDGPGTYHVGRNRIEVQTRSFRFWDGPQASGAYAVQGDARRVTAVTDLGNGKPVALLRFDPMLIGSIYPNRGGEDRVLVRLAEVPKLLPQTLVLVEDRGFYHHFGISIRGIARASVADLFAGHIVQGASTITQQLIRNLFLSDKRTYGRKVREALMAILLERHVSKDQILEAYLNEAYLGQDGPRAIHGFGLASRFYFNKPLDELRPAEIAMLVAIVKGPSYYNPRRNPKVVLVRRNLVLRMMRDAGLIPAVEYKTEIDASLGVTRAGSSGVERYPAFVELVEQQLKGQYDEQDLTGEGLRIFTTLAPPAQAAAEREITGRLPEIEKAHRLQPDTLQAAAVVVSVSSGEVLAMVGGRDPRYAGYNRALDAQRQIGSLAKPFDYLAAFEHPQQFSPATMLDDSPLSVSLPGGRVWAPENYDRKYVGPIPAFEALAESRNVPTVRMALQIGVPAVQQVWKQAGVDAVPALPSIFLGAMDLSPLQVAQAYSTLAGGGFQTPLLAIKAVTTADGQPLKRFAFRIRQTLPEGPVYLITWGMAQVIAQGTGRWAKTVLPPAAVLAGKTGTTQDFHDSWFAGFDADHVAVVWVGRDDSQPTGLEGATGALRIWAPLMRDLHPRSLDLIPPDSVQAVPIDLQSGLLADTGCADAAVVPFLRGFVPTQYAPCANAAKSSPLDWLKHIFK